MKSPGAATAYTLARLARRAHGGTFDYRVSITPKGGQTMEIDLTTEQKARVTVTPKTATGNPAELDGPVSFTVMSDPSSEATVEQIDDRSAFLVPGSLPGDVVFLVQADADLGEGVENLTDTVTLQVAGPRAVSLGLEHEVVPK